ncbi:MAG: DUF4430 domain-containing protein [Clostridia bacterium]|nr:DUF4430 domain-containing protein [Clostridia bacterium]
MKDKKRRIRAFAAVLILSIAFFSGCGASVGEEEVFAPAQTPIAQMQNTPTPEPLVQESKAPAETKTSALASEQKVKAPAEPQIESAEKTPICTLLVRCDSVFRHLDKLSEGKRAIIPPDGIIFPKTEVSFSDGESVFDVLKREMRNHGIHMEFVDTPIYHSAYIEGIGNLYEFDCGDTSGWTYMVNGESPNYGCSQYPVKENDAIEFVYRCSLFEE